MFSRFSHLLNITSAPDGPEESHLVFLFVSNHRIERSIVALGSQALNDVLVCCQVIQFGADCDQDECTCRDPDAEENKNKAKHLQGGGRPGTGGGIQ